MSSSENSNQWSQWINSIPGLSSHVSPSPNPNEALADVKSLDSLREHHHTLDKERVANEVGVQILLTQSDAYSDVLYPVREAVLKDNHRSFNSLSTVTGSLSYQFTQFLANRIAPPISTLNANNKDLGREQANSPAQMLTDSSVSCGSGVYAPSMSSLHSGNNESGVYCPSSICDEEEKHHITPCQS